MLDKSDGRLYLGRGQRLAPPFYVYKRKSIMCFDQCSCTLCKARHWEKILNRKVDPREIYLSECSHTDIEKDLDTMAAEIVRMFPNKTTFEHEELIRNERGQSHRGIYALDE